MIEEKLNQAQFKKRKRIEAGRDPIVAGWQCALEEMIIRLEAYLRPGELVTFKMLTPEEKEVFNALRVLVSIPRDAWALFISPSVIRGIMYSESGAGITGWPAYYRERHPDSGVLVACRQRDYDLIINALLAHPPFTPGVDIYEDGVLVAGYSYDSLDAFQQELSGVLQTYLGTKSP